VSEPEGQQTAAGELSPGNASTKDALEVYACWNKIGVYGNGQCAELTKFIHCRNCPVYSSAGVALLDRPLPKHYRREWTQHFAAEKRLATPAKISAIIFSLGTELLALPTQAFQEVAERRLTHSLPHRRQGIVLGLVNIRGELLICVAVDRLLGLGQSARRETRRLLSDRLMVVNWESNRLAFPVDEIYGMHRFQPQELREPPATVARANPTYTQGVFTWQDKAVGYLDADTLFSTLNRSLS
jgi:chemotaxis-related protein WspD